MRIKTFEKANGFTLIELTIVIVVMGVLVSGALAYLTSFELKSQNTSIKQRLDTLKIAIETHIDQFGSLPCPSSLTALPGTQAFSTPTNCEDQTVAIGQCAIDGAYCIQGGRIKETEDTAIKKPMRVRVGAIPARAINVPYDLTYDSWKNRIVYAVTEELAAKPGAYYQGEGGIGIIDESGNSFITPEKTAAYVILSHGIDASGGITLTGGKESRPCPGINTLDGENCDYKLNVEDAVFRVGFFSNQQGQNRYDDLVIYDTKNNVYSQNTVKQCKDMPVCSEDNIETAPICKISGGSDGLPLCTTRVDVKGGVEKAKEYEHDITTWKHACDFGEGWRKPSIAELRILHENKDAIGGFADNVYYLTRSYYNPGLIENDDRKLEIWAKKFNKGRFENSKEETLNLSPQRSDKGEHGYIRCIRR